MPSPWTNYHYRRSQDLREAYLPSPNNTIHECHSTTSYLWGIGKGWKATTETLHPRKPQTNCNGIAFNWLFSEMTISDVGLILKGETLVLPCELQDNAFHLAHQKWPSKAVPSEAAPTNSVLVFLHGLTRPSQHRLNYVMSVSCIRVLEFKHRLPLHDYQSNLRMTFPLICLDPSQMQTHPCSQMDALTWQSNHSQSWQRSNLYQHRLQDLLIQKEIEIKQTKQNVS